MTTPAEALTLKEQGNKAFKEHDWANAISFYTQAIDLNDKEPTFYTNRAQVGAFQRRTRQPTHSTTRLGTHKNRSLWARNRRCDQSDRTRP